MQKKWVSVWGNAMSIVENKPESYAKEITLRYPIFMPLNGNAVRITLDNFTGIEEVVISKITVARTSQKQDAEAETFQRCTFAGETTLVLKAGEQAVSDPIKIPIRKGESLTVSLYLKDYTQMRCGVVTSGPLSQGWFARGDQSEAAILPRALSKETEWVYFLSQVDVSCEADCRAILCFGDSITSQAWPELLQLKLTERQVNTAVVRRAVSGSRVLRQYDCVMYEAYGLKGSTRFPHELAGCGIDTVIVLQGVNDLIHPVGEEVNEFRPWSDLPTAQQVIEGLQIYIKLARKQGLAVWLGTIMPMEGWRTYQDFRNELRCEVNAWIRTTNEIDGFIDFDELMQNPENPNQLKSELDSGDHLHPSFLGHERMADEVLRVLLEGEE